MAEPTVVSASTAFPASARAEEIRFALIGEPSQVNVWELYDDSGSTYVNRALFGVLHPRLYELSPLDLSFQAFAADGFPSEVVQDGEGYSATVKIRGDLKWTDGSPFTAEDAAFTANTVLAFEFGYDWGAFYPKEYLLRAEAADPSTIRFVFKKKPNMGVWQYGILQAPIVQKAFWEGAARDASLLLPDDDLRAKIASTRARLDSLRISLDLLSDRVASLRAEGVRDQRLESDFTKIQSEVLSVQAVLQNLLDDYDARARQAQKALREKPDEGEPSLGVWLPYDEGEDFRVYKANPEFPFGAPNFDRASYRFFEDEESALAAFENGEVDFILSSLTSVPESAAYSPTYRARFLVFNPQNRYLADPALRTALACVIDRDFLTADLLERRAAPLNAFVLSPQWNDPALALPCDGLDETSRLAFAEQTLKEAGYSWGAGQNLKLPTGEALPAFTLLAPLEEEDALRSAAADYITRQARLLGVVFSKREAGREALFYALYSSQKYDAALMGWRLSEYPAYLCEWFGGESPLYEGERFKSVCQSLKSETNPEAARRIVSAVESALLTELPFLPLFTVAQPDVYRRLSYPAPAVLNGWTGWYGAPMYAVPAP